VKVALLKSHFSSAGGLEKATRGVREAFEKRGCTVHLLTTQKGHGIEVCRSPLRFESACKHYLDKHPHDLVFAMDRTRGATHYRAGLGVHAVYLERRKKLEGCAKIWCNPRHYFLLKKERALFEDPSVKRLFANSEMVKKEIVERFSIAREKIAVVYNGVDMTQTEKPFLEKTKNSRFTFLFVGNGYRRKGLDLLLQALPKEADLIVVGRDKNLASYRKKASKNVTFVGEVDSLLPYYKSADALVIPSLYDPFANVTVEALAMGLYVVSSLYNGGHEVLQEGCGSVIEDLFSPESLHFALKKAMETTLEPHKIRNSVKHLDFSSQCSKIVDLCLC